MKIKTFGVGEEDKINSFIDSVVLVDDGAVQVTSADMVVVFYKDTKDKYEQTFVTEMLEALKRNRMHESVLKATIDAQIKVFTNTGGKSKDFDDLLTRQKDADKNIKLFDAKIAALETWLSQKPTSNK